MQKTTFPVQVLIHDDASTDATADIMREYERKYPKLIQCFYQKKKHLWKAQSARADEGLS
jgi:glycosyltransferase involved in cell wall biosynthesis